MSLALKQSKPFIIALLSGLVVALLPLESQASRFARNGDHDNFRAENLEVDEGDYEESENFIPPPAAPPGGFSRFNRGNSRFNPPADQDDDPSQSDARDERRFNPAQVNSGSANPRFGNTSNKVEFKLVSPEDEAQPKNPRSRSYEMYKSYSTYKRLNH